VASDVESIVDDTRHGRAAAALLVLLVPLAILIFGMVAPAAAGGQPAVTEADKELLIKVRLAGLWEIPAGQMAREQAASQAVMDAGAKIAQQHQVLDEQVRAVAGKLGVKLPDQPSEEQQGWLAELSEKQGPEFDKSFAQLLRAAHGKVFTVIAQVRAGTRNEVIRDFANKANETIKTDMNLLESTGQVDFNALPEPVLPGSTPAGQQQHPVAEASALTTGNSGVNITIAVLICVMVFALTLGLVRVLRTR
jgi:predicted outer membrane protein